jgi:hypothetical protein
MRQVNIGDLLPEGKKFELLVIKAAEDPDEMAFRLLRERWTSSLNQAVYFMSWLFLTVIGVYCCFVVIRYGVEAPEARTVFPLLTTLFGGVLGVIVGKAAK